MTASRRQYPAQPALAVSIAVFREDRVLLARRVGPPFAGCFTLPGGLVELGETVEAAALRELREETGVLARLVGFNQTYQHIAADALGRIERHYVILSFAARWLAGEGECSLEASDILWRRPQECDELDLTPGALDFLRAAAVLTERAP